MRIGVAKLLHKFPHEVDGMLWEDVMLLVAHGEMEAADMKRPTSGGGTKVTNFVVRPKEQKRGRPQSR